MNIFKKTVLVLYKVSDYTITLLVTCMMLTLIWQVFTRFVIKIPSIWTEEIARYTFTYMVFIGAALGVKENKHFGMTLLIERLSEKAQYIYQRYIINSFVLLSSIFLFIYSVTFNIEFGLTRVSPTFLIPMIWTFLCIPLGAFLIFVFSLYNIIFGEISVDQEEITNEDNNTVKV